MRSRSTARSWRALGGSSAIAGLLAAAQATAQATGLRLYVAPPASLVPGATDALLGPWTNATGLFTAAASADPVQAFSDIGSGYPGLMELVPADAMTNPARWTFTGGATLSGGVLSIPAGAQAILDLTAAVPVGSRIKFSVNKTTVTAGSSSMTGLDAGGVSRISFAALPTSSGIVNGVSPSTSTAAVVTKARVTGPPPGADCQISEMSLHWLSGLAVTSQGGSARPTLSPAASGFKALLCTASVGAQHMPAVASDTAASTAGVVMAAGTLTSYNSTPRTITSANGTTDYSRWNLGVTDTGAIFTRTSLTSSDLGFSSAPGLVPLNTPFVIASRCDGATQTIWLNGVMVASRPFTETIAAERPVIGGTISGGVSSPWDGTIFGVARRMTAVTVPQMHDIGRLLAAIAGISYAA